MQAIVILLRNGFVCLTLLRLARRSDWHAAQARRHQMRAATHLDQCRRVERRIWAIRQRQNERRMT